MPHLIVLCPLSQVTEGLHVISELLLQKKNLHNLCNYIALYISFMFPGMFLCAPDLHNLCDQNSCNGTIYISFMFDAYHSIAYSYVHTTSKHVNRS